MSITKNNVNRKLALIDHNTLRDWLVDNKIKTAVSDKEVELLTQFKVMFEQQDTATFGGKNYILFASKELEIAIGYNTALEVVVWQVFKSFVETHQIWFNAQEAMLKPDSDKPKLSEGTNVDNTKGDLVLLTPHNIIDGVRTNLEGLLFSSNTINNINNIGKIDNIVKEIIKVSAEAKQYNAPKEFGKIETDDYILTFKQGLTPKPLDTIKIVNILQGINPELVAKFALEVKTTKVALEKFCTNNEIQISKEADIYSDEVKQPNANSVTISANPKKPIWK